MLWEKSQICSSLLTERSVLSFPVKMLLPVFPRYSFFPSFMSHKRFSALLRHRCMFVIWVIERGKVVYVSLCFAQMQINYKCSLPPSRKISSYLLGLMQFSLLLPQWCCCRFSVYTCSLVCFAYLASIRSGMTGTFLRGMNNILKQQGAHLPELLSSST